MLSAVTLQMARAPRLSDSITFARKLSPYEASSGCIGKRSRPYYSEAGLFNHETNWQPASADDYWTLKGRRDTRRSEHESRIYGNH